VPRLWRQNKLLRDVVNSCMCELMRSSCCDTAAALHCNRMPLRHCLAGRALGSVTTLYTPAATLHCIVALQIKRNMLNGASDGHGLPQKPSPGAPLPMQASALHASGSAAALAVSDLADGFGRNVSLSSTNSVQPGQGGSVNAVEPNPMSRARSVADTGNSRRIHSFTDLLFHYTVNRRDVSECSCSCFDIDVLLLSKPAAGAHADLANLYTSGDTHSTNSAGAIEPIMSSSMLLANSHQQHMGLGTFDPIWQPGETVC
jgi:hypothetical protein